MSVYVIADLHLSFFPGADKPMDIFGARWLDHARRLEENWRARIGDEDTVVIPGDISWALKLEEARYDLDWVAALPGRKVLLKGNHDLWWAGITKLNKMYDNMTFLQNDCYEVAGSDNADGTAQQPGPCWICGSRGWLTPDNEDFTEADEKIYRRELLRLESSLQAAAKARAAYYNAAGGSLESAAGPIIGVLHYPPVSDVRRFSGFQQLFEDYGVNDVYYGHVHGEDGFRTAVQGQVHGVNYHLVSLDYLNCEPLKIW